MKRPLIIIAILFSSGIALANLVSIPLPYLFILTIISLVLTIALSEVKFFLPFSHPSSFLLLPQGEKAGLREERKQSLSTIFLCATVFLLGALSYQNACRIDPLDISNFVSKPFPSLSTHPSSSILLPQGKKAGLREERNKVGKVYVIGIVTSDPVNSTTHYGDNKSQFYFKPSRMQKDVSWHNVNGSVLVTVYGKDEKYRYGDELVLEGELTLPKPPSNPGGYNYQEYLKRRKVYSTIKVENTDLVKRLRSDASDHLAYRVFCFKDRLRNIISSNLDKLESSILRGILLGDREDIPVEMMDEFIKTGTVHILPTQYTKKFEFPFTNYTTS